MHPFLYLLIYEYCVSCVTRVCAVCAVCHTCVRSVSRVECFQTLFCRESSVLCARGLLYLERHNTYIEILTNMIPGTMVMLGGIIKKIDKTIQSIETAPHYFQVRFVPKNAGADLKECMYSSNIQIFHNAILSYIRV